MSATGPELFFWRGTPIDANAGVKGPDGKPQPARPAPSKELAQYLAAFVPVCVGTYYVCMEWPTTSERQAEIARLVGAEVKAGRAFRKRGELPAAQVDVKEPAVDLSKPLVAGVRPMKEVTVKRSVQEMSCRVRFVGEKDADCALAAEGAVEPAAADKSVR